MDESEIVSRIGELVEDEHKLEKSHTGSVASEDDLARLREIEIALDQCWDLLRQRRARRDSGQNPDDAAVRPAQVVEGYRQ